MIKSRKRSKLDSSFEIKSYVSNMRVSNIRTSNYRLSEEGEPDIAITSFSNEPLPVLRGSDKSQTNTLIRQKQKEKNDKVNSDSVFREADAACCSNGKQGCSIF